MTADRFWIMFVCYAVDIEPGHDTLRFRVDSEAKGRREIDGSLSAENTELPRPIWGVLLDAQDGSLVYRATRGAS